MRSTVVMRSVVMRSTMPAVPAALAVLAVLAVLALVAACAPHPVPSQTEPPRDAQPATAKRVVEPPAALAPHAPPAVAPVADAPPAVGAAESPPAIAPAADAPPAVAPVPANGARCVEDGAPYDAAALREAVAYLAGADLDGRVAGSRGDAAARAYIADRFRCLGLVPAGADDSYEQPFDARGRATANVVGYIPGDDPAVAGDIVLIGAHHDHLGGGRLGANDNASGVVALLAIAQAIRRLGAPRRTIAFAAFGAEELGMLGSEHFAANPPAALPMGRIVYYVNLDMLGSYAQAGMVSAMGTFRGLPATAIVRALAREHRLQIGIGGRAARSDHRAFCRAGIPYVFFWTPDRRCYHAPCDTVDNLDAAHLSQIAAVAGGLVERLSSSPGDLARSRAKLGCSSR
jgi:hypothetical protein